MVDRIREAAPELIPDEPDNFAFLLGLRSAALPSVWREVAKGLPYRAFELFVERSGADDDDLLQLVGVPRRTLARRKADGRFTAEESDRLVSAAKVVAAAVALFEGDRKAALDWLHEPLIALGGAIPWEAARFEVGAREVEAVTHRLEHGVYS